MKRILQQIRLRPECLNEYRALHDQIWPETAAAIRAAHLENYSIFYVDGRLMQYMEYIGDDFERDMQRLAGCDAMRRWCAVCSPMQIPSTGQWEDTQEVFHLD